MRKLKLLLASLLCSTLMLTGCNKAAGSESQSVNSEPEIVNPSEPSEPNEPSESEIVDPSEPSEPSEPTVTYTAAEAIDAVAGIMTEAFNQTVAANHDDNGDYIVLNFGDAKADTIKEYCSNFIPEGFELAVDWSEDSFEDGTPVEYTSYVCGDIALQYAVYTVSGHEGDEAGYNGLYLQIDAYLFAE